MIYMKLSNGRHLLVLEPANLARLQDGEPMVTPNKEIMIAYTPDIVWLTAKLMKVEFGFTPSELDDVLAEALKREPIMRTNIDDLVNFLQKKERPD
jgi:hypothetical protein